jgi:hypothetical protein
MIKKLIYSLVILLVLAGTVFGAGLTPNLMNEDFNDITSWTETTAGTGVSSVSANWLDLLTGATTTSSSGRSKIIVSSPDKYTVEMETLLINIGSNGDQLRFRYYSGTHRFDVKFQTDGLSVNKTGNTYGEVGTDIVVESGSTTQKWRFQVDKSGGDASATVEVFLNNVSQGTVDCDMEGTGYTAGTVVFTQLGATADQNSRVNYVRIASGLGAISDTSNPIVNIF